eukprot:m.103842 g.103842  ORF g.103842 m.103842 type:complete len:639 (+) comp12624_c1_seq1:133-2049(+)
MDDEDLGYEDVHAVHIDRGNQGFGFNIKGTTATGGNMFAINGRLYPPLQYISHVDVGGAGWNAGLRCWDRILSVNKEDMKGAAHSDVVQAIIRGGNSLDMVVMSVDDDEAARLQRAEDSMNRNSKKGKGKAPPIAVNDYNNVPNSNGKGTFTVFNIFTHGEYRTSKRYSELAAFHKELKARFRWNTFPPFPPKKMNGLLSSTLSPGELEERRHGLEVYLQKVFNVDDIRDSDNFTKFLKPSTYVPPKIKRERENNRKREEANLKKKQEREKNKNTKPATTFSASKSKVEENAAKEPSAPKYSEKEEEKEKKKEKESQPQKTPTKLNQTKKQSSNLFDFDDESVSVPQKKIQEEVEDVSIQQKNEEPVEAPATVEIFKVLLPTDRLVEVEMDADVVASDLLKTVLDEAALTGFSRNIFRLFEAVGEDKAKSVRPKEEFFARLVGDDEVAHEIKGHLLLRRWLFTKSQEVHAQTCGVAVEFLLKQTLADIEHNKLFCGPKKKKKLATLEHQEDIDPTQVLAYTRKLHMYGGIKFPPCVNKDAEEKVVVTVAGDRVVIQKVDDNGEPSTAEDGITLIEVSGLKKVKRRDDLLALRAEDSEGEVVTIRLHSQHAAYLETCMKRALEESKWVAGVKAEMNFFQ